MHIGRIAFRLGADCYLGVQTCDEGYDYTIYDDNFRLVDGGQIDKPDAAFENIIREILIAHKLEHFPRLEVDYDQLIEKA